MSVRLLIDGVGTLATPDDFFASLLTAGGRVAVYRRPSLLHPPWRLWRRDHRKILVVDDEVGFIGGLNIGDDYAPPEWGGHAWRDSHAKVSGPAVREMTRIVNRTWRHVTGEDWMPRLRSAPVGGDVAVEVVENRFRGRAAIRRAYVTAIRRARESIRIANAYFIPDRGLRRALVMAAQNGVRVQLLLAGRTDVAAVRWASRAMYRGFMRAGVEIYECTDRVLHAKTAVVDGRWCSIGSFNMDHRSVFNNLEANVVFVDERLGVQMCAAFDRDMRKAMRIDADTWHRRHWLDKLRERIFYQLRVLL